MKLKILILSSALTFGGCASMPDWIRSNTTKEVLIEIANIVFTTALQSFTNDSKVDFGHAMAKGLWSNSTVAINSGAVSRIANAWSTDHLPALATATSTAYKIADPKTPQQKELVINTIATAISQAAEIKTSLTK